MNDRCNCKRKSQQRPWSVKQKIEEMIVTKKRYFKVHQVNGTIVKQVNVFLVFRSLSGSQWKIYSGNKMQNSPDKKRRT